MNVIVIGTGVGMAHVCALVRSGNSVIGIVDLREDRLHDLSVAPTWDNSWLHVHESVPSNPFCSYGTSVEELSDLTPDLIVIATPPNTQKDLYSKCKSLFTKSSYLLEKPLSVSYDDLVENTYISCEWVYNPELIKFVENGNIKSLSMCYPSGGEAWKSNFTAKSDMLPHLLSILWRFNFQIYNVDVLEDSLNVYRAIAHTNSGEVHLSVGRPPILELGTFCNGKKFDWYFETFDEMYKSEALLDAKSYCKFINNYEENISSRSTRLS